MRDDSTFTLSRRDLTLHRLPWSGSGKFCPLNKNSRSAVYLRSCDHKTSQLDTCCSPLWRWRSRCQVSRAPSLVPVRWPPPPQSMKPLRGSASVAEKENAASKAAAWPNAESLPTIVLAHPPRRSAATWQSWQFMTCRSASRRPGRSPSRVRLNRPHRSNCAPSSPSTLVCKCDLAPSLRALRRS